MCTRPLGTRRATSPISEIRASTILTSPCKRISKSLPENRRALPFRLISSTCRITQSSRSPTRIRRSRISDRSAGLLLAAGRYSSDCICISEQAGFAGLARSVRPRSLDFRGAHYLRLAHSGCAWGTVPVIFLPQTPAGEIALRSARQGCRDDAKGWHHSGSRGGINLEQLGAA